MKQLLKVLALSGTVAALVAMSICWAEEVTLRFTREIDWFSVSDVSPQMICDDALIHPALVNYLQSISVEETHDEVKLMIKLNKKDTNFDGDNLVHSYISWRMLGFSQKWTEAILFGDGKPVDEMPQFLASFCTRLGLPQNQFRPAPPYFEEVMANSKDEKLWLAEDNAWILVVQGSDKPATITECWILDRKIIAEASCVEAILHRGNKWNEAIQNVISIKKPSAAKKVFWPH